MKNKKKWFVFLLLLLGLVMAGTAVYADITATYTLRKSVIGGGGHQNSTGGTYALSGTTGQAAAQAPAAGGSYSLSSGFWNDSSTSSTGRFQFSAANYTVMENAGTTTITVVRASGSDGAVSVHYATSDGTAVAVNDYTATSGTLNFADGETSKTFTVAITNDSVAESDESVNLILSSPTGGTTLGTPSSAVLTITESGYTVYLPVIVK